MATYFDNQDALIKFRFHTTLPVQTLPAVHRLIEWAKRQDISMAEIKRCGHFFNLTELAIDKKKLWNKPTRAACFVFALASLYAVFFIGIFTVAPNLLVQLKTGEKPWFFISEKLAVNTLTKANRFSLDDCIKDPPDIAKQSGWTINDVETVCDVLKNPNLKKEVTDLLLEQRIAALVVTVTLMIFTYMAFSLYMRSLAAEKLEKFLISKKQSQLELDLNSTLTDTSMSD